MEYSTRFLRTGGTNFLPNIFLETKILHPRFLCMYRRCIGCNLLLFPIRGIGDYLALRSLPCIPCASSSRFLMGRKDIWYRRGLNNPLLEVAGCWVKHYPPPSTPLPPRPSRSFQIYSSRLLN